MLDEYRALVDAYAKSGGDTAALSTPGVGSLFVHQNRVLSSTSVPGLDVHVDKTATGVDVKLRILKGHRIERPVHLCFGVLPSEGVQKIKTHITAEEGASAVLLAHCTFPNAVRVKHIMDAVMEIGAGADVTYTETHYHGPHGGVEVIPVSHIKIGKMGRFTSQFTLTEGRVGRIDIDYDMEVGADAAAEITAKVYGSGDDNIRIRERAVLAGRGGRSIIKSRVAVRDSARSMVESIIEGRAPHCRGHVDCVEIVRGGAVAEAVPMISVSEETTKVTHEAAIGSVDKKQLETLMSRGVGESEAVDVIVRGLLK